MSNKDIFSFNPFKRDIDEQLDTPINNAGIMSKDVSSDIEEAEDSTYDPFSFVDRFAKGLVSLFDENEEDRKKLQNTYMADTSADRLAARDSVLDEFVVDYNAAFERGRLLTEASTIETLPLPPIGEADPLRKTVTDAIRSSDRPRGLMEDDDGDTTLPQFRSGMTDPDSYEEGEGESILFETIRAEVDTFNRDFERIKDTLSDIGEAELDTFRRDFETIKDKLSDIGEAEADNFRRDFERIKGTLSDIGEALTPSAAEAVPVPKRADPVLAGFMPSDGVALDAVRGFLGAATDPSNTEFVKRNLINVVDDVGKKIDPNNLLTNMSSFATSVGNAVDTASSTPAKLLLQDLLLPDVSKGFFSINENYFSEDEIAALRQLARKKGEGIIYKGDYKDVTIGDVWGANEKSVVTGGLTMGDRLYNSLGRTKIVKDKETGEYYVEDTYDFNLYKDYTQGRINPKTGRRAGKTYTAEEFENSLSTGEELLKTLTSDASLFEIAHNVAFLFGSRDYKGTDRDTGRKMRINLGDLKGSPDSAPMPRARPAGLMTRTS